MKNVDFTIIGAGPAGLAAGFSASKQGDSVVILESESQVGGLSKTLKYKDYHFDIGGHRFLTKIKAVNDLWKEVLPDDFPSSKRLSRIYYKNRFFHYPLRVSEAMFGLNFSEVVRVFGSFIKWRLFPKKEEKNFEDWVSNRFGYGLYSIFFKSYTEKVWGIPCSELSADWAAQRISKLNLAKATLDALGFGRKNRLSTLADEYYYPPFGPGQMYQAMTEKIEKMGGKILRSQPVKKVIHAKGKVVGVLTDGKDGKTQFDARALISSMPLDELALAMEPQAPQEVIKAANKLRYRAILTINFIVDQKEIAPDNWIYLHSPNIMAGRMQLYKNWSPKMVPDENMSSLGLEYFSSYGEKLHDATDNDLLEIGKTDLEKIGLVGRKKIVDGFVARYDKAYPIYEIGYEKNLKTIRDYLDSFSNLACVGRYGQFRYNNMDHSILTGIFGVQRLSGKDVNPWDVNTENDYLEQ